MNGFNIAAAGHTVNALSPQSISGGKTSQAWSMKGADHVSIIIPFGAIGGSPLAPPTAILVNQCSNANGGNPVALVSFRYYYQLLGGAGNDILNGSQQGLASTPSQPPNYTTASLGITAFPSPLTNGLIIIEIDAAELESATVDVVGQVNELPYLNVQFTDSGNTTYAAVIAVLSGLRYAYNIGASATL